MRKQNQRPRPWLEPSGHVMMIVLSNDNSDADLQDQLVPPFTSNQY